MEKFLIITSVIALPRHFGENALLYFTELFDINDEAKCRFLGWGKTDTHSSNLEWLSHVIENVKKVCGGGECLISWMNERIKIWKIGSSILSNKYFSN